MRSDTRAFRHRVAGWPPHLPREQALFSVIAVVLRLTDNQVVTQPGQIASVLRKLLDD